MTEKETMLSGGMYDSQDKELVQGRDRAHVLPQRLEALLADDHVGRERLTRELLGAAGRTSSLRKAFSASVSPISTWAPTSTATSTASWSTATPSPSATTP